MPLINQPSPAPRIPSAFGLGDINPQCVPLSGEFRQTDLECWSNDDLSNGYRLAARQWQVGGWARVGAAHHAGALGDWSAGE